MNTALRPPAGYTATRRRPMSSRAWCSTPPSARRAHPRPWHGTQIGRSSSAAAARASSQGQCHASGWWASCSQSSLPLMMLGMPGAAIIDGPATRWWSPPRRCRFVSNSTKAVYTQGTFRVGHQSFGDEYDLARMTPQQLHRYKQVRTVHGKRERAGCGSGAPKTPSDKWRGVAPCAHPSCRRTRTSTSLRSAPTPRRPTRRYASWARMRQTTSTPRGEGAGCTRPQEPPWAALRLTNKPGR